MAVRRKKYNGKIYNTETSELLYTAFGSILDAEKEDLYITENGDYFIAWGIKNAITHSGIYPLTDKETVQWLADRRTIGYIGERFSEILAINNLTKLKYNFLRLKVLSYSVEAKAAQASMQGRVLNPCVCISISDELNRIMDEFEVFVSEIITINFHFLIMEAPHEQ